MVSRSLSPPAASTRVHAFVVSRLDYCSAVYEELPICRLDRVLRTAARLVGRIPKLGRVSAYMRDVLHWLPYPHRFIFRLAVLIWRCLPGLAPAYLRDLCYPTLGTRYASSLRSMERGELFVPFPCTSTRQARAFSVVGPSVLNGLPLTL